MPSSAPDLNAPPTRPLPSPPAPLVAGAALALLAALALPRGAADVGAAEPPPGSARLPSPEACAEGLLPDDGRCLRPGEDEGAAPAAAPGAHRDRSGRWATYEQIPRLPDRPEDYAAYTYPIPTGARPVLSGYDLDHPDATQRRGARLRHVGHGGLDLGAPRGTAVTSRALERQEGPSTVVYAGALFGLSVVTRHAVREAGALRDYLVLHGHLDRVATGVAAGVALAEGALLGAVGDSGSPGLVHLHLEVRRVRDDVDLAHVAAGPALMRDTVSVVSDPRNVLPLAPSPVVPPAPQP